MFENFISRLKPQDLVSKTGGDSPQSTGDSKLYSGVRRGYPRYPFRKKQNKYIVKGRTSNIRAISSATS